VLEIRGNQRIILDCGVIKTVPKIELSQKMLDINADLVGLIEKYRPTLCGIEKLYFHTNVTTGIDVAQSRGAMLLCLAQKGVQIREYTPLQVKKGICGNGRAPKAQVQNALRLIFGLREIPKPDDAADALAIAYIASLN
jgi:crossover junction endodeoxyribonuclease RuvC